jgi:hypothetical protein
LHYLETTDMTKRATRATVAGMASLLCLGASGAASANTVQFEAESIRDRQRGTITSPLLIKDDPAASGGSYIAVADGTNSGSFAPDSTEEGVAKYTFSVADTGTYRVWARVSAATNADDSFWVRMGNSGSWIRFNGWTLGTAYHWVLVANDPPAAPSTFALTGGADNELQVAYREDGTRLDAFYVTNDTSFNPNAAIIGAPALPILQSSPSLEAGAGGTTTRISWSDVQGATSYRVEVTDGQCNLNPMTQCCEDSPFQLLATTTGHKFIGAGGKLRVTAVGPTGSSVHPVPTADNCFPEDPSVGFRQAGTFHWRTQVPFGISGVTSPMQFFTDGGVGAPAGNESLNTVPAHGRARMDFELGVPVVMRLWAEITAPNPDQDSFWVRFDDGAWIKWNNLGFCSTLYNSDLSGSPIVRTNLGVGSHRLEFAWREGGARLADNIILLEDSPNQGEQCSD